MTIPAGTATGTYYVIAKADGANVVSEVTETNNTKYSTAIKIGPDLTVSALTVPTSAKIGATISITDTTKNIGAEDAGASTTKFYFSTNSAFDGNDTYLGSRDIPTLIASTTNSGSTSVTIPAGTATGTYYIIAVADADNVIAELTETNNTYARSISIVP
ncbi:MAG: hypothetical protein HY755_09325 [Nitrospirae bacterium]|nr:hypothetical protein [Nitrospirota bacterium]